MRPDQDIWDAIEYEDNTVQGAILEVLMDIRRLLTQRTDDETDQADETR